MFGTFQSFRCPCSGQMDLTGHLQIASCLYCAADFSTRTFCRCQFELATLEVPSLCSCGRDGSVKHACESHPRHLSLHYSPSLSGARRRNMYNSYLWLCLEKGTCAYTFAIPLADASDSRAKDVSFIKCGGVEPSARGMVESCTATFLPASPGAPASNLDRLSPADEVDAIDPAATRQRAERRRLATCATSLCSVTH